VEPGQLSALLLVGGSARMPLVSRTVTEQLGCVPTVLGDEDQVARGAVLALSAPTAAADIVAPTTSGATAIPSTGADTEAVRATLERLRPDVVVNTTAFHNVPRCETSPDLAFTVNAVAPLHLARACTDLGARLVHDAGGHRAARRSLPGPWSAWGGDRRRPRPRRPVPPRPLSIRRSIPAGNATQLIAPPRSPRRATARVLDSAPPTSVPRSTPMQHQQSVPQRSTPASR
jgi:hypothetical protein